ncbi:hypothetical protein OPT61_g6972 [Boeremia exigua]|uniref:Uncharacterized protein n=1 Tax=Boeremia exigua TaxID=749465 RepID=A0ACC2I5B6_9PLEO|nr:hypothetical protein OPT61_g6972 [Boeremia exigua]
MVSAQLEGWEDALTVFRCLSTVSVSQRRRSSKYVQQLHPPHRAHRESDAPAALARELFRHRSQGVAEDHGQIPHPALGQGRHPEKRNRHGPHSRIIDHEDRERRAARSAGQHTQAEGYGFIQRKAARYGSACARTEDKIADQHCEKAEQDRARRHRASADVRMRVYITSEHHFDFNCVPGPFIMDNEFPVLIIGAGISGLLIAQQLRQLNIPFRIFERDSDFSTRGPGWGLTLHWSLPALRELLPEDLLLRLPDTYVDRAAVERGESSTFPFFDLTTGEKKGASPRAGENERIRVTRVALRRLLATGIDIEWNKTFRELSNYMTSVGARFEDGTECRGRMLFGCDGSHSRVRHAIYPPEKRANYQIPVCMFGFTMQLTAAQAKPIRELDPFFLQGTASANDVFMYISLLKAPEPSQDHDGNFLYQVCISGSTNKNPFRAVSTGVAGVTNSERIAIIRDIARDFAEPFCSFLSLVSDSVEVKRLDLDDYAPCKEMFAAGTYTLIGDAFHAMAMYRGEGANHAIVDVLELKRTVLSKLGATTRNLQFDLHEYQQTVANRTLPAVLASRQACLDAHDWANLTPKSPLLTKRQMILDSDV